MTIIYTAKTVVLAAAIAASIMSCNGNQSGEVKPTAKAEAGEAAKSEGSGIAYIDTDSLISQYDFCKDYTLKMTQKSESIKSTLTAKGQAFETAMANYQKRLQTGAITSEEQNNKEQRALQKQQNDLQQLQEKLSTQFGEEQEKFNNQLRDSIKVFLGEYNKSRKFSIILSKAGDNILYADKSMDITADVVNGLNKRYKAEK